MQISQAVKVRKQYEAEGLAKRAELQQKINELATEKDRLQALLDEANGNMMLFS